MFDRRMLDDHSHYSKAPRTTVQTSGNGTLGLACGGKLDDHHDTPRAYGLDLEGALESWDPFTWGAAAGDRCTPLVPLARAGWLAAHHDGDCASVATCPVGAP